MYSRFNKIISSKTLFAAAISVGAMMVFPSSSQAMVLQNCDSHGVGVKVTGQSSGRVIRFRLEPGQKKSFQTSRSEKWRLNLNPIGKDVQYSGQRGDDIKSFVRIAGNLEVTRGLKCEPEPGPDPIDVGGGDRNGGGGLCLESKFGKLCLTPQN